MSAISSSKIVKTNRINQKVKTKNKIKIPIIKIKDKFMSRNKKRKIFFFKKDLNDVSKRIHDNNSVNNTLLCSTINSNFNNRKDSSSNTTLNNINIKNRKGNTNFNKIIQNNNINSNINMIINYHNKKDIIQNNKNITMKNSRTRNTVYLNDNLQKTSLRKARSKKIFQKKVGIISKYKTNIIKRKDINIKILHNYSTINDKKNEARLSNLSKKNSINSVEEHNSKLIKETNKINIHNSSNFQKSRTIKDNKNIIKLKNNVLFQRKINDYLLNNDKSKYKSKIKNKSNK